MSDAPKVSMTELILKGAKKNIRRFEPLIKFKND